MSPRRVKKSARAAGSTPPAPRGRPPPQRTARRPRRRARARRRVRRGRSAWTLSPPARRSIFTATAEATLQPSPTATRRSMASTSPSSMMMRGRPRPARSQAVDARPQVSPIVPIRTSHFVPHGRSGRVGACESGARRQQMRRRSARSITRASRIGWPRSRPCCARPKSDSSGWTVADPAIPCSWRSGKAA
jgi:hypothetical protein